MGNKFTTVSANLPNQVYERLTRFRDSRQFQPSLSRIIAAAVEIMIERVEAKEAKQKDKQS